MVAIAEILTSEGNAKKLCTRGNPGLEKCGYRYDAETENYYVRNRYYSPTLGRWLTRDPIGHWGGINLYGYANSSPVGNVDAGGVATIGERRIVGDTFALRPALRHSSPGLIHTEQRAVNDMGAITTIAGLPEALSDLSEGASALEAWESALYTGNSEAMDEATSEWTSWLAKYEPNRTIDAMQKSVKGLMKSDLKGYGNGAALTQGWAVWVRVKYQQYQEVDTGFWIWKCKKTAWVTHHQWIRGPVYYPHLIDPLNGYPATAAGALAIATDLPWIYAYANSQVLAGGVH